MMYKRLLLITVFFASISSHAQSTDCVRWYDFSTLGVTNMQINSSDSFSELNLQAGLIYRPLIEDNEYYWLGFQLFEPDISLNSEQVSEPLYSVPFAVQLDKSQRNILDVIINAEIKFEDRSKLTSIYDALHIRRPYSGDDPTDYLVEAQDDLGIYEVRYQDDNTQISKQRTRYKQLGITTSQNAFVEISDIIIHADDTIFTEDNCWHQTAIGASDIEVLSADNFMQVRVEQQLDLVLREDPPPSNAELLQLPLDPRLWEPLAAEVIYPKPERNPEDNGDEFLRKLGLLDLENMSSAAILQYLYDNDEYIPLLKGVIWADLFSDKAEQRLFLMIGKTDSANAHWLLTEIYVDETFDGDARFRSLMALKYAEKPVSTDLIEQIFAYSMQPLTGENADLASSALLTLGVIAKNQLDEDFGQYLSDRIATELRGNSDRQQSASLLTALGNAGDESQQYLVEGYLNNDDSILRQRSAEALAHMPTERSRNLLSQSLRSESNTRVQAAMLEGLGANTLDLGQVNQVYEFASTSDDRQVRSAAIGALTNQVGDNPEVKTQLRNLLKTEKNRSNLQQILRTLY